MTAVPAAQPLPEAADFLARLHDGETGHLSLFAVDRTTGDKTITWAELPNITPITSKAAEIAATHCVWIGIAPRSKPTGRRRGSAADCVTIPALWVDIDHRGEGHAADDLPPDLEAAHQLLNTYPIPPTVTVETGGGLQAYWQLLEPLPTSEAATLLSRWGATWVAYAERYGWGIDNVWDVARVLRLPGTLNNKTATPRPVTILQADWDRRYGIDDLDQWLIDPPEPPATRPNVDIPWIGPQRPGDAFNASVDPETLLLAAGCHFDNAESGNRHYRAPHHPRKGEGTGITIYADGHTTIYSETFARQHGMEPRRPYDPFGLYTHLQHRGDWRAATTALSDAGYGERPVNLADLIAPTANASVEDGEEEENDWQPHDLAEIARQLAAGEHQPELPQYLEVVGALPLLYPGRVHSIFGPPGGGKTWVALCALVERLKQGEHVLLIDWEDSPLGTTQRLVQLGCTPDELERFHYRNPVTSLLFGWASLENDPTPWTLIVIDSAGEALAAQGIELADDAGTARWMGLAKRLTRRPERPCVTMLDHIPKANADDPAKYAIGSQRKLAAITGASYRCDTVIEPAKGKAGKLKLVVAKDRLGNRAKGGTACEVNLHDEDELLIAEFTITEAQAAIERGEKFRPTYLMERVCDWLKINPGATRKEIETNVSGKAQHLRQAVEILLDEEYVAANQVGKRVEYRVVKAFNEALDALTMPVDNSRVSQGVPGCPKGVPDTVKDRGVPGCPGVSITPGPGTPLTAQEPTSTGKGVPNVNPAVQALLGDDS